MLDPSVISLIPDDKTPWEGAPLETLARTGDLMAYRHSGFWQPMDTLRDKNSLEAMWLANSAPWKVWP